VSGRLAILSTWFQGVPVIPLSMGMTGEAIVYSSLDMPLAKLSPAVSLAAKEAGKCLHQGHTMPRKKTVPPSGSQAA
jgi:hypothetical protein